jgi:UrcA family protein
MKMLTTVTALLLSVSFGSALSVPANADTGDVPSITVKYADLNVSRVEGAMQLYRRIQSAASIVCSSFDGRGSNAQSHFRACVNRAIGGAVAKVDNAALNAIYGAKAGATVPTRLATHE